MGFQAILALQCHGQKTAVRGTEGVALYSSPVPAPVLSWRASVAGSGQQQAGPHGTPLST